MTINKEQAVSDAVGNVLVVLADQGLIEPSPPHANAHLGELIFEAIRQAASHPLEQQQAVSGDAIERVREAVARWFEGGQKDQRGLWDEETDSLMAAIAPALSVSGDMREALEELEKVYFAWVREEEEAIGVIEAVGKYLAALSPQQKDRDGE